MKIGQGIESLVAASTANLKKTEQDKEAAPASLAQKGARATPTAGSSVSVSTLARTLEKADPAANADFNAQKVADIKASIQDGSYAVNPEAIADKLLSNAQEMLDVSAK